MNEYDKQAEDFLAKTGTTLTFEFDGYRKYFPDDKEKRLTWKFTLTRGTRSLTDTFGGSLQSTAEALTGEAYPFRGHKTLYFKELLETNGKRIFKDENGDAILRAGQVTRKINPPSAYDILTCLQIYEPEDIDYFAEEMGIAKPSEAIRIHAAVTRQFQALQTMYNDDEMRELQEIN